MHRTDQLQNEVAVYIIANQDNDLFTEDCSALDITRLSQFYSIQSMEKELITVVVNPLLIPR